MTTSVDDARYTAPNSAAAEGWRLERLTAPSRLFGANGLRTGPDGRVYVAQVTGSQISALDVVTGQLATVSAKGGDIIAPDDVAFDAGRQPVRDRGDGRPGERARGTSGQARVLRDDIPCANGITVHQDRLFISEMRRRRAAAGAGPEPAVSPECWWSSMPMLNAMEVGPDGLLYFPLMGANEIWRVDPNGGEPQRVAG